MLWAITSYFNPVGYRTKLANYRIFRAHLTVPLLSVEASLDGQFELEEKDAEILVQRVGGDVLWQKERLLNVALAALPPECEEVAWVDCDVVFDSDDWALDASSALDDYSLLQLFSRRCNLGRDAGTDPSRWTCADGEVESVASRIAAGRISPQDLYDADAPFVRGTTAGLAWAARRESLAATGLYDACILGTGDRAMLCAAMGEIGYGAASVQMSAPHEAHYRGWASRFASAIGGRVGSIEGRIYHLWHGDLRARRYGARHAPLRRFDFDPSADIAVDDAGCWRWSSAKPDLHDYVRRYFATRMEDGVAVPGR